MRAARHNPTSAQRRQADTSQLADELNEATRWRMVPEKRRYSASLFLGPALRFLGVYRRGSFILDSATKHEAWSAISRSPWK